jgi:hypothetical protein
LFHAGVFRGGLYQDGGIFWADREETLHDPLQSYHQIIGHTKTYNGLLHFPCKHPDTSLTYIDCLETTQAFYELTLPDI